MTPNGTCQYAAQKLPPIPSTLAFSKGTLDSSMALSLAILVNPSQTLCYFVGHLRQTLPEALAFSQGTHEETTRSASDSDEGS